MATVTWRRQDDDREEEYQVPVIPPARYFQAIDAQKAAISHGTSWADDRLTGMVRMAAHRR